MHDRGVIKIYRISHFLYIHHFKLLARFFQVMIRIVCAATIPYRCKIGKGTKMPHGAQGVVLNENVAIGENCLISAGVVIGGSNSDKVPRIGNNCIIGANATIIGNVDIGENTIIGAGSVVTKSIKSNCVAVGNPAKIIKENK